MVGCWDQVVLAGSADYHKKFIVHGSKYAKQRASSDQFGNIADGKHIWRRTINKSLNEGKKKKCGS